MNSKRSLLALFLTCTAFGTAGCQINKRETPKNPSSPTHSPVRESSKKAQPRFTFYSDDRVAFQHPSHLKVRKAELTKYKNKRRYWAMEAPTYDYTKYSKLVISEYFEKHKETSLDAIFKSKNLEGYFVHSLEKIIITGGVCLSFRLDTKTSESCWRVEHEAHCFASDMRYFTARGDSTGFCGSQPHANTQANIDAYGKLIRSLEIKPLN